MGETLGEHLPQPCAAASPPVQTMTKKLSDRNLTYLIRDQESDRPMSGHVLVSTSGSAAKSGDGVQFQLLSSKLWDGTPSVAGSRPGRLFVRFLASNQGLFDKVPQVTKRIRAEYNLAMDYFSFNRHNELIGS